MILTGGVLLLPEKDNANPLPEEEVSISSTLCTNSTFSEEELISEIQRMKIKYPHIVLAQARLETGHFTSDLFVNNNNLFGMKLPWNRPTTAIGVRNGHAVYKSWRDSLIDYALYSSRYIKVNSEEEYLTHLGKYYAQDPKYKEKVKRVINEQEFAPM